MGRLRAAMPIKVRSNIDTDDGRLLTGKIYIGYFVWLSEKGMRFLIKDSLDQWMTFDTEVFKVVS